jgi:Phosphotransferase enzyme family
MQIPETFEEATAPEWIASILGAPVARVEVGEVDNRVSTNIPVAVHLTDGSVRRLWIKGYFNELGQYARTAGVPEANFYASLAADTGMRGLRCVYAAADAETLANVVVTHDVLSEGATFLDSLHDYSVEQTADSLGQLATLHAGTWMRDSLRDEPWLAPRSELYTLTRGVAEIESNFRGPIGAGAPDSVRDAQRLFDAFKHVAMVATRADPWCVIHGDPHIGNLYLDGAGRPVFVDWQLVQRGPWWIDVGYHLASSLSVDDRRRSERDLVAHYLDRLAHGGITLGLTDEDLWHGIRLGMVHGFYLWGITQKVDPRKTTVLLERLGTAVADHNAFTALGI